MHALGAVEARRRNSCEQSQFLCLGASPATLLPKQPACEGASGKQWFVLRFPFFLSRPPATTTIHHLCLQTPDKTILYSVATTLVNCTNSYDVKEVIPELVQLAKFSKQHVPEEHPKVGMRTAERGRRLSTGPPERWDGKLAIFGWCVCVCMCVRVRPCVLSFPGCKFIKIDFGHEKVGSNAWVNRDNPCLAGLL